LLLEKSQNNIGLVYICKNYHERIADPNTRNPWGHHREANSL
jgi:hypothetical protein